MSGGGQIFTFADVKNGNTKPFGFHDQGRFSVFFVHAGTCAGYGVTVQDFGGLPERLNTKIKHVVVAQGDGGKRHCGQALYMRGLAFEHGPAFRHFIADIA